ncbi:MAG: phosphoribosylformylglycinamidine synthase subunit PurQ [Fimbriimonadaceae bacterium]|nr:MAG: phosphoribosylformylglycinamidine synthase subunit PurQ [Fimbriimonadaceae bacterium]
MRIAVVRFPGANCDQDALHALRDDMGFQAEYVWHEEASLAGFEGVFLPGGFSYGDYLRGGAIAARAPIMDEVKRFAQEGRPVLGACNGFQVLCEAGILSGALLKNRGLRFVCRDVWIRAEERGSIWTEAVDRPLQIPIAHNEGRFTAGEEDLRRIEGEGLVAFRYVAGPDPAQPINPNGSANDIAGVFNPARNVLGMMPHPERASRANLGSTDGRLILQGFATVLAR